MTTVETVKIDRALGLPATAESWEILDNAGYTSAAEFRREVIRALADEINATFDPHIDRARALVDGLRADKKRYHEPLKVADEMLDAKMRDYMRAMKEQRLALERAAQVEAEAAAKEQARIVAAAQAARRQEAEAAAVAAEDAGATDIAEAIRREAHQPVYIVTTPTLHTPLVLPESPVVDGVYERSSWKARVLDINAVLRWVMQDIETRGYLVQVDQSAANREAKQHKERLGRVIPGLEAYDDGKTVIRKKG